MGIEPTLFAWEARVLPLNDTRSDFIIEVRKCHKACVYWGLWNFRYSGAELGCVPFFFSMAQ